jgi:hypothetical protein
MNDTLTMPRELAFRLSDGIEVALLWQQESDELTVAVVDARNGHAFALPVGTASPLDVFYHPYWHAARRAVDTGTPVVHEAEIEPALGEQGA